MSFSVSCHKNDGKFRGGLLAKLDESWDWNRCLSEIQRKFKGGGDPTKIRVFTSEGYEVSHQDQLVKGEGVCVSLDGSDFIPLDNERTHRIDQDRQVPVEASEDVASKRWVMKFIIVGSQYAGKSCILSRFTEKKFPIHTAPTLGCDFSSTIVREKDSIVRINIWDTAGQEHHRAITKAYFRDSAAAILVYDITKKLTFEQIPVWLSAVRQNANNPSITLALCGNKVDLSNEGREVSKVEGEDFARKNGMLFFETSAKEDVNVTPMFHRTVAQIVEKIENNIVSPDLRSSGVKREENNTSGLKVNGGSKPRNQKRGCCR